MAWALYDGRIVAKSSHAIGLGSKSSVEVWIPHSQVGKICYQQGGDSSDVRVGESIEAIEIPEWLARTEGLELDA